MCGLIRSSTLVSLCLLLTACATSPTGRHQLLLVSEEFAIVSSREAYLTTVRELDNDVKLAQLEPKMMQYYAPDAEHPVYPLD